MNDEMLEYMKNILPDKVMTCLSNLSRNDIISLNELRLRVNFSPSVTIRNKNMFLNRFGLTDTFITDTCQLNAYELQDVFAKFCRNSVYAHEKEIVDGYISADFGIRVGIVGNAVYENDKLISFRNISAINIRFPREVIGCGKEFLGHLGQGLLISGPPGCGKTTILRDLTRILSYGDGVKASRVVLIDSRNEIAALSHGMPSYDVGPLTDILSNIGKATAVEIAVRTMNPEYIIMDEIGNLCEAKSIESAFFCGVKFIISAHAESLFEIKKRDVCDFLIKNSVVSNIAFKKSVFEKTEFSVVEKEYA